MFGMNRYSWAMVLTFIPTIIGVTMSDMKMLEKYSLLDRFFSMIILLGMLSLFLSMLHTNILGDLTKTYPWLSGFLVPMGAFAFVVNLEDMLLSLQTETLTKTAFKCDVVCLMGGLTVGLVLVKIVLNIKDLKEVITPELQM